jgi:GNAT superfamily N-acetyltransferase
MAPPAACTITPGSLDDLPRVMPLVASVGWPHRAEDVAPALALGKIWRAMDPDTGDLLGIAVWWPMEPNAGRVGLVIVSPDAQGHGIGRALMDRVLDDTGPRSLKLLATKEGQPLYEKLGFKSVGRSQKHQGVFEGTPKPHPTVARAGIEDLAAIARIDERVLGVNRGDIPRHLFETGEVNVLHKDGEISGFAILRPFGKGYVLGPLVAESEGDALALLHATVKPGLLRVDRFTEAEHLGERLSGLGLKGLEVTDIMVRGDWPAGDATLRAFAMASHAWG